MKRSFVILLLHTLALWGAASDDDSKKADEATHEALRAQTDAFFKYTDKKREAQRDYRNSLAEMLLKADKIELFLLDFAMAEVEDMEVETFPIAPFRGSSRVLAKKTVPTVDLASFKTAISEVLSAKEDLSGVLCHYPIHGIRVYRAGVQIFESSLCWTCCNYSLGYPDGPGIETMSLGDGKLKELIDTTLPIPPEEVARFKSAIEKMNSKNSEKKEIPPKAKPANSMKSR